MIINGAGLDLNNLHALREGGILQKNNGSSPIGTIPCGGTANRFDRLVLNNILGEYTNVKANGTSEIKKMLSEINISEKPSNLEIAVKCYSQMQNLLQSQIKTAEYEIDRFNKLSEEKQYYSDLLNSAEGGEITVSGGRYLLSGLRDGAKISCKDLEDAVSYIEKKISDELICRRYYICRDGIAAESYEEYLYRTDSEYSETHVLIPDGSGLETDEKYNEVQRNAVRKYYNGLAAEFSKATGIDMGFEDGDSALFSKAGLTEENFVEKTLERIEALKNTSQSLKRTMRNWLETQTFNENTTDYDLSVKVTMLLEMRGSFSDFDLLETLSEENGMSDTE